MDRATSGSTEPRAVWSRGQTGMALALVVATVAGMAVMAEPAPLHLVGAALVIAVVLAAVRLDAFGGIAVGVGAAAAFVAAKQVLGVWSATGFWVSLASTVALLALGWVTSVAAGGLRERGQRDIAAGSLAPPAYGSLGLITGDVAMSRLEEEVARGRRHKRPLSLVLLVTQVAPDLPDDTRRAAHRSVARLVESLLRETDVPFALVEHEIGAILPETGRDAAWQLVGRVLDALGPATFASREDGERLRLADCAEVMVGLVSLDEDYEDAQAMLAAARRAALPPEDPRSAGAPVMVERPPR